MIRPNVKILVNKRQRNHGDLYGLDPGASAGNVTSSAPSDMNITVIGTSLPSDSLNSPLALGPGSPVI